MGTGIGCQVYADGNLLADGSTDPGDGPVVLSGLEIDWGRSTTVDQPDASTCSLTLDDPPGGGSFVDQLRTGTRIAVYADATVYPDPTEPVWPDPGFETGLPGTGRSNAVVSRSSRRSSSGAYSLRFDPVDPSRRSTVAIAPAPFSAPGTAPDAWDDIPTTSPGQTWSYGATIFAPPGAAVRVRPILFNGPYAGAGTVVMGATQAFTGTGDWQTITGQFVPNTPGAWVGLQVSSYPTGLAWDELPPDLTWDDLAAGGTPRVNRHINPRYIGTDGKQGGGAGGWTQADVDAGSSDGDGYTQITVTATQTGTVDIGTDATANTPVTPGETITLATHAAVPHRDTLSIRAIATWLDATGTPIANTLGDDPVTAPGNGWLRYPVIGATVPDGATDVQIRLRIDVGTAPLDVGDLIRIGQRDVQDGDQLLPYFDGDYPDTPDTIYDWTAEPNASPSTATPVSMWATWQWDDFGAVFVDDVTVLAPDTGTESSVLVYAGRVASLEASWDDGPVVAVECVDFTADMENVQVGSEPWAVETMGARFQRIVSATGMAVTAEIDDTVAGILVSWRDVDSQAAAGLLAELAESVDAVLWSATHAVTGPYLRVEDPTNRPAGYWLTYDGTVVTIIPNPGAVTTLEVSACDVLRDDVTWAQDTQDVITRASVSWQAQGVDDDGKNTTTEKTVQVVDEQAEVDLGVRGLSLSTQLQAAEDAAVVADKLLARTSVRDWRATGLVIDDTALDDATEVDINRLLTLLDGTSRNGLAMTLTDLPAWAPTGPTIPIYLEGGRYAFEDGAWLLDLTVSNSTAQGASATWDELPPATWDQFGDITWDNMRGVAVAPEGA